VVCGVEQSCAADEKRRWILTPRFGETLVNELPARCPSRSSTREIEVDAEQMFPQSLIYAQIMEELQMDLSVNA